MKNIRCLSALLFCVCFALSAFGVEEASSTPPTPAPEASAVAESPTPDAAPEVVATPEVMLDEEVVDEMPAMPEMEPTTDVPAAEAAIETAPAMPDEAPAAAEPAKAPRFVVILPERIDNIWFWFYVTDESEHVVQSAVEKALVRAGIDVVDISAADVFGGETIEALLGKDTAVAKARQLGADYVILGTATASKASEGVAYGVTVIRAGANITAKIVRVSDGKIMAVVDASAQEGGQAVMAAGREALKKAGKNIGDQLVGAIQGSIVP
ncbi:MAG TPA: hypothetical protein PLE77_12830 [Kiritimatiellia bacterium]|nr:hypothetical protein [Kiritimatiellia bacterium]